MRTIQPVRMGVAGVGGYARNIAELILEEGEAISPRVRLAAVCEPDQTTHAERIRELGLRGVKVFETYDELLAWQTDGGVEAVWLPLPIQLHRPFTEQALAAGKGVMVEKPAAATIDDVDAMIAARDRAGQAVAIGFQDIYDGTTLPLKERLLDGLIGTITHATVYACWPRSDCYFARSDWAGRVCLGDVWVLDSPANNALSHQINIALFLMGEELLESAAPRSIEAELYRAARIESYDTISARASLATAASPDLLVLLTHATATTRHPVVVLHGERGTVTRTLSQVIIETQAGQEVIERDGRMYHNMLERFARMIRGQEAINTAAATLEIGRAHTLFINSAYQATPVIDAPRQAVRSVRIAEGETVQAIVGIEDALEKCAKENQMLHDSGQFNFTRPAGRLDLQDYRHFTGSGQATQEPARQPERTAH